MCWYYFDVLHDGDDVTRDHKGTGLADMEAARAHALGIWRRIIEEQAVAGRDPLYLNVAILDIQGTVLALIPYPTGHDGKECALG
jgi:hypothetical protein